MHWRERETEIEREREREREREKFVASYFFKLFSVVAFILFHFAI